MEFKINFHRQIQLLKSDLIGYLIGTVILGFIVWHVNYGDVNETIVVTVIALLPLIIPMIVLHSNYVYKNYNQRIKIDKEAETITKQNSIGIKTFSFRDIKGVTVVKGIHYKKEGNNNTVWTMVNSPMRVPWTDYGYVMIEFKTKETIILTTLMIDLKKIPFTDYKKKYQMFPFITD